LKQKSIASKLRTSLNEHRLGVQMPGVKLNDIAPDNAVYEFNISLIFRCRYHAGGSFILCLVKCIGGGRCAREPACEAATTWIGAGSG
jgi:hypothetical protein